MPRRRERSGVRESDHPVLESCSKSSFNEKFSPLTGVSVMAGLAGAAGVTADVYDPRLGSEGAVDAAMVCPHAELHANSRTVKITGIPQLRRLGENKGNPPPTKMVAADKAPCF